MIISVNDGEHSSGVSVEWTLDHFFVPLGDSALFNLVIIHTKPFATIIFSLLLLSNPDLGFSQTQIWVFPLPRLAREDDRLEKKGGQHRAFEKEGRRASRGVSFSGFHC
ncbi:hypothetical protein SLEP1_g5219 [Rubroshorea leprosula]|uniref:Uncharacterized protein n=1 Tax=Rubroshorea leprosula TaxID=152421 RepID=A0AAV5HXM1_9ROSI|nr:hypothetical protein SLEP1_g5219 [Rubroshorea leprosula]